MSWKVSPTGAEPELLSKSSAYGREKFFNLANLLPLKVTCWAILVAAGLVQTWFLRHRLFSDGVSYLAIARNYAAGDWHAALNSYWSPLYSWLLALLIVLLRPSSYWEVGLMHLVNLLAYLVALVGFELFLDRLIHLQQRLTDGRGVTEQTVRIAGYSTFLISALLLIGIGYNSPDMVAFAIGLLIAWILLKIEAEPVGLYTYISLGCLLGLEFLTRSAFAVFIPFYLAVLATLLWRRYRKPDCLIPVLYSCGSALLVCVPFILALSISKGRFKMGDAGKLNYAWEVDGAARSTHWQGEPYDIGKPIHPTHKVLAHPATYTFGSPVPGSYPPWYEPSYWYAGVAPHLKWKSQLVVLRGSLRYAAALFLFSAVTIPAVVLIFLMGWSRWLSSQGILPYWFLLLPSAAYISTFTLVYVDKRYVAGSLLVIWMCLLASIQVDDSAIRSRANGVIQVLSIVFGLGFLLVKLGAPALYSVQDLSRRSESEWNLNWVIAERLKEAGLQPGDRIAAIGETIDAEWASIDKLKVVAEVPVIWDRNENIVRNIFVNRKEIEAFWLGDRETQAKVLDAFRNAGATFVVADQVPPGHDRSNWIQLLPKKTPRLPWSGAQYDAWRNIAYMRLDSVRTSQLHHAVTPGQ